MEYRQAIVQKLTAAGGFAEIPKQRKGAFTAQLNADQQCIHVNCLGNYPNIPLRAFDVVEALLRKKQGKALRGNAMNFRLGEERLPCDSVEGRVAHKLYGLSVGDVVFRRITPLTCILVWAGVCVHGKGMLIDSIYYKKISENIGKIKIPANRPLNVKS